LPAAKEKLVSPQAIHISLPVKYKRDDSAGADFRIHAFAVLPGIQNYKQSNKRE
jgi:hypothetical protein